MIEMIRLQPLPQIALTNLQPAFYDVESVTAIEMVSKFYSYLQNLVNDYNSFVTEVNNNIDEFESGMTHDFECFRNCIIKTMNDYIESIDMKISLQDNTIAEAIENQNSIIENAVDYMKNNRELTDETISKFGLGYSPAAGTELYKYLSAKGHSDDVYDRVQRKYHNRDDKRQQIKQRFYSLKEWPFNHK